MFHQLDVHLGYDLKLAQKYKVGITADIFNVLNSRFETNRDMRYLRETYFGTPDTLMPWDFSMAAFPQPDNNYYGKAINYNAPIRARLGIALSF